MWYVKANSYRWVDPDKYISITPFFKDGKLKYRLKRYKPRYGEEVVSCLHPFILTGSNYYIKKLIKQYGVDGLLRMLRKPKGTSKGVQFCVQCSKKHKIKKIKSKYNDLIEKSGYMGMNYIDGNAKGVTIVTEKC